MDVLQAIQERRSTRAYLDKPVDKETLEKLISFASQAPSAINIQPWELVVVSGEERKRLSRVLVKRMREKNISCGPGAKKPLPEHFVKGREDCSKPCSRTWLRELPFRTSSTREAAISMAHPQRSLL